MKQRERVAAAGKRNGTRPERAVIFMQRCQLCREPRC
jgi:hypothetical protein